MQRFIRSLKRCFTKDNLLYLAFGVVMCILMIFLLKNFTYKMIIKGFCLIAIKGYDYVIVTSLILTLVISFLISKSANHFETTFDLFYFIIIVILSSYFYGRTLGIILTLSLPLFIFTTKAKINDKIIITLYYLLILFLMIPLDYISNFF